MRDDRQAIFAGDDFVGLGERFVHVALVLFGRFVFGERRVGIDDLMLERLVLNFDQACGFLGDFLGRRRDRRDDFARVPDFLFGVAPNAFDAGQRFRRAGVDAGDLGVGMGRSHYLGPEHAGTVDVVGIFGGAGGLQRAVNPVDSLADERPLVRGGPFNFSHITRLLF